MSPCLTSELQHVARSVDGWGLLEDRLVNFDAQIRPVGRRDAIVSADLESGAEHIAERIKLGNTGLKIACVLGGRQKVKCCRMTQAGGRSLGIDRVCRAAATAPIGTSGVIFATSRYDPKSLEATGSSSQSACVAASTGRTR